MQDTPQPVDPALIIYLKRLVTILTGTMIIGLLVIVVIFVIRFPGRGPDIPDGLTLPGGTGVSAYTMGQGWAAVVTTDNRILIYDAASGAMLQEVEVTRP